MFTPLITVFFSLVFGAMTLAGNFLLLPGKPFVFPFLRFPIAVAVSFLFIETLLRGMSLPIPRRVQSWKILTTLLCGMLLLLTVTFNVDGTTIPRPWAGICSGMLLFLVWAYADTLASRTLKAGEFVLLPSGKLLHEGQLFKPPWVLSEARLPKLIENTLLIPLPGILACKDVSPSVHVWFTATLDFGTVVHFDRISLEQEVRRIAEQELAKPQDATLGEILLGKTKIAVTRFINGVNCDISLTEIKVVGYNAAVEA